MSLENRTTGDRAASNDEVLSLRELFCHFYRYPLEQFEQQFLDHCSRHPNLFRLVWRLDRDFFTADLELARKLGGLRSFSDCRYEIEEFRRSNPPSGLLRKVLKLRLSGQEAIRITSKLFLNHTLPHRPATAMPKPVGQVSASRA